jgi:DNA-binding CsgD family transcriptional regulator/tetratricopeptide (TPR) repeat protein
MARPGNGTVLVGRDQELSVVERLLRGLRHGEPGILAVVGEAGMGKTTLADALARRSVDLGLSSAVGHCLDVTGVQSFAPFLEALRGLGVDVPAQPRLDTVVQAVLGAASDEPLVLVVEDVHWAAANTFDALRALAHLGEGHFLLVLTLRPEEGRPGRLRDFLVDLDRTRRLTRLELRPLDAEALGRLAHDRLGAAEPVDLEALAERSGGNPLFAEELLDSRELDSVPPRLADLFLSRLDRLPRQASAVLQAASVLGTRIEPEMVATITGLAADQVNEGLRVARDHHLVVVHDDRVEFRHALVRDALDEDLMPAERRQLHGKVVIALRRRCESADPVPSGLWSRLAFHAAAAGDERTALWAAVQSGRQWHREGLGVFREVELALELWPRVVAAEEVTGTTYVDLACLAAEMLADLQDPERGRALIRQAMRDHPWDSDPLQQSRVYLAYASLGPKSADPLRAVAKRGALAAAGTKPTRELVKALLNKSIWFELVQGHYAEAASWALRSAEMAEGLGLVTEAALARHHRGLLLVGLGRVSEGMAEADRALAAMERADDVGDQLSRSIWTSWNLGAFGPCPAAVDFTENVAARASAAGLLTIRFLAVEQLAFLRVWAGDLGSADALVDELEVNRSFERRVGNAVAVAAYARGDLDRAVDSAVRAIAEEWDAVEHLPEGDLAAVLVDAQIGRGDLAGALAAVTHYLDATSDVDSVSNLAVGAAYGHLVLRALDAAHRSQPDSLVRAARSALMKVAAVERTEWAVSRAAGQVAVAEACAAGLGGSPCPDLWREVVRVHEDAGLSFLRLRFQPDLAEDLWAADRRSEARALVHDTWHEARSMGAGAVAQRVSTLAGRWRVALPEQRMSSVEARLSPREREVLSLLEAGATNRDIATALFISEKTASVHVSHLLTKLGAVNRGQAVAMAHRAREHDDTSPP